MDKTYQLTNEGQFGTMLKVVPMTDENVMNQINCFAVNGSHDAPVTVQSILPDLTDFKLKGTDLKNGHRCQKWQKKEEIGHKQNKYTMWVREGPNGIIVPVHYEMKGFNSLLGSHYDHYFLTYHVRTILLENDLHYLRIHIV